MKDFNVILNTDEIDTITTTFQNTINSVKLEIAEYKKKNNVEKDSVTECIDKSVAKMRKIMLYLKDVKSGE